MYERGRKSPLLFYKNMISKETVEKLALERITELNNNLYIVELTVSASNNIQLELDKSEGYVSVEDCISVSRNIEHNLDRETVDFELNVSSAGIDKPLRHPLQFLKYIGKEVDIKLQNGTVQSGVLVAHEKSNTRIEVERKEKVEGKKKKVTVKEVLEFSSNEIKEVKVKISFK